MSFYNNIFVAKMIYLQEVEFSKKICRACLDQGKKFGIEIIPFKGIHGLNSIKLINQLSLKPRYFFKEGRRGVFGCFLSHYLLWLECIRVNKPYLILEHDAFFIRDLPPNIIDKFDDVLKLDNEDPYNENYEKEVNKNYDFEIIKYYNNKAKNLEINKTGNYMRGAYSYIIKPEAAKKIVAWIKLNGFLPADIQIGDKIVDIKVTIPTIARIHPIYNNQVKKLSLTKNII